MRSIVTLLAFIAVITVAGTTFYLLRSESVEVPIAASPSPAPSQAGGEVPAPATPDAGRVPEAGKEKAKVVWVSDGDTIVIQPVEGAYAGHEQRIRLIGLDAPEMHPTPQCWAKESTAALLKMVPRGSTVTIAFDFRKFDDYKRQLRYVWNAAGQLVNAEQLREGNGFYLRIWPNVAYDKEFKALADQAKAQKKGLWGACKDPQPPVHTGNPAD
ncbi:thermonuclease family protein [Nonomuraea sp. NPDC050556]|uniref:thermonuclease family protein n=1 Tax=Nonomuraea sp. NPDC050556 TaxID=3364369 RepID=UPI00378AADF1